MNSNTSRVNILIISFDFCLEAGGIQNTSYLLAEELTKYANVFTFCPADGHSPNGNGIHASKGKIACNGKQLKQYNDAIEIIGNLHKTYHIDYILCCHLDWSPAALFLKKKYDICYGIMTHGNELMKYPLKRILKEPGFLKLILRRRKCLKNADQIFCNSNFTKNLVVKLNINKNVSIIHPPISLALPALNVRNRIEPTVLSIGRLIERKGYHNVIKALPDIIKYIPNIRYVIAGTGNFEGYLKELAINLGVEKHVSFKGRVSEEEKCQLLSDCDIFILPSYMIKNSLSVEGYGLSLLEANMYGKFVISTYSGGIPDAVKDNETGFLIKENDVDGITEAIVKFFNPNFSYNPKICVKWAEENLISNIASKYWMAISDLIAK